jgi:hypothetical protein
MGDLDLDLHPGFAWAALLLVWMLALVIGGAVINVLRRPFWLRRLRKLDRGREAQRGAQ